MLILLQALAPATLANPQGGHVTAGSASIDQTSASRLDVNQHSDRAVIDWRSFDIRSHEHTNFRQPSASAIALNRVQGSSSSLIDGRLTANGQVFLVNQNGVLFGKNARVDVAGLVATTADIHNEDFMNGHYRFDKPSANPDAQVVNQGRIQVQDGGAVVLAAPRVSNEGLITARLGNVALAGAKTFTLDFHGDGLLQFDAGSEVTEKPSDLQSESDALVSNSGTIVADGGIVAMSARAADGVVDRVINMDGVVQARAVALEGGKIVLSGGDEGIVAVSGKLDASGLETGQKGGEVRVLGEKVGLFDGARIDVSGDAGGGEVLIGGNYQGKGPAPNAKRTFVAAGASIKADATSDGDGGKVIVWADEVTRFRGDISAQGGNEGGDGGFVEVSGKAQLEFAGDVNTLASKGETGTLLLDPDSITIVTNIFNGGGSSLDQVDEFADLPGQSALVLAGLISNAASNVVLQARNSINFNGDISMVNAGIGITALAGNDINVNANITTQGGDLHFEAGLAPGLEGRGSLNIGNSEFPVRIRTNGGDIDLIAQALAIVDGVIDAGTGDINIARIVDADQGPGSAPAAADITVVQLSGPDVFLAANDFDAFVTSGTLTLGRARFFGLDGTPDAAPLTAPALTVNAPIQANATNLALISTGALNINADVTAASLTASGATISLQDVTTTGSQSYTGAVTLTSSHITNGGDFSVVGNTLLGSDSSVSTGGGGITFNGLIDSAVAQGDPAVLTLDAVAGPIALLGNVGSTSPLGGLDATGGRIGLQDVTTTGFQRYTGAVTFNADNAGYLTNGGDFIVNGDASLASPTSVRTAGGQIEFGGRLNGSNPLSLFADAGDILFRRDVGTVARLGAVTIGSANDILIGERFVAGDSRFTYTGLVTSPPGALDLASLFLSPTAEGATLFGTVRGVSGDDAALAVEGPRNDLRFTINNCVIGVPCGQPPVVLQPQADPIPPKRQVGLFGTTPSRIEARSLWAVYKRRPPSEDPTDPQYSNFGNEELWD